MAETRVDLLHLLEDLRDAYPGAVEETILTEVVANSLDSGATLIRITANSADASLTIADNGSGMPRPDLRRYHDLAASTKTRGQGIGFAGVGIKLALLVCREVVTETRRGKSHVATQWHLATRHRAPWKWVPPPGMLAEQGTAVRLHAADPLTPLTDRGFIEATLRRHYQPLLDPACDPILEPLYPQGVSFEVNGDLLRKQTCHAPETASLAIHSGRKRKPSAAGYLYREAASLPEDQRGIAISTYGKIIKRGWDWLGVTPSAPERIGGVIEAPLLAASLTLNKGDFIRTGQRGAAYLAFRKAIQEVVVRQLAQWGDAREASASTRPRSLRVVERDLRYFNAQLERASVVDLHGQPRDEVHFGAAVAIHDENGKQHRFTIVGDDEADVAAGKISWASPLAKAMIGARVGDTVIWRRPAGDAEVEIVEISYPKR